jgi:hypothetical protein
MNTSTPSNAVLGKHTTTSLHSPLVRFFAVVARPQSYRNIAYLLLGLALGTLWFSVLVTAVATSASLVVVALLGIPMLWATWYVVRAFANVERGIANVLLDREIPMAPMASGGRGNVWVRLKAMSRERPRWRELAFLLLRFPVGVATFTAAVTLLTVPVSVAYAPFHARYVDDVEPFGDWFWSNELEDFASGSPWSWLLVPLGVIALFGAFHALNALARACGHWVTAWLDAERQ